MASGPSIYALLPQLYRTRDKDAGFALQALAGLLEQPRARIEADIEALYRDWFVETCAPWALPYLAALAGREGPSPLAFDPRALVGDAIAFARRKGSYTALEHELAATTGWPVQIGFDAGKAIARYWDEPVYALREVTPSAAGPGRYRFHPMGIDCRLFAAARGYTGIEAPFVRDLDAPQALTMNADPLLLARAVSVLIEDDTGKVEAVPPMELATADLAAWRAPPGQKKRAWVDPLLGRLLLSGAQAGRIAVDFAFAAPGNVGGGAYERAMEPPGGDVWIAYVHRLAAPGTGIFRTLDEALEAYREVPGDALIRILDSSAYEAPGREIGAAPLVCPAEPNAPRRLTIEALSGETPLVRGTLRFAAGGAGLRVNLNGLWVDGLVEIEGAVHARLEHCSIHPVSARRDAAAGAKQVSAVGLSEREGRTPSLALHACLTGPLELPREAEVRVDGSAVDGYGVGMAIAGGPAARIFRSTLLGGADLASLEAIDAILGSPLTVPAARCELHHCFIPESAAVPAGPGCISGPGPTFESTGFGSIGYARLDPAAGGPIYTAASNGSEIGLFNAGHRAQRIELMETRLVEVLPITIGYALERQSLASG